MIWFLNKKVVLMPPKMGALQFGDYVKSGIFFYLAFFFKILLVYLFYQCRQLQDTNKAMLL